MITINRKTKKLLESKIQEDVYIGLIQFKDCELEEDELLKMCTSKYLSRRLVGAYLLGNKGFVFTNLFLRKYGHPYNSEMHRYRIDTGDPGSVEGSIYLQYNDFILLSGGVLTMVEKLWHKEVRVINLK